MKNLDCLVGIILYKSNIDTLIKNIKGLMATSYSCEIFLLDNAQGESEKELFEKLKGLDKDVVSKIKYQKSENIGFGAGHNKIFELAQRDYNFEYYLCCNPDGVAKYDMLDTLIDFAKSKQSKGIFEARQFPIEHPKVYNRSTKETAWCSGCCVLIPSEIYKKLNGFDDDFFMYMEDVDLSWRTRQLGNKCYIVDSALFSHSVDNSDRDMTFTKKTMCESAYILGKKYGALLFPQRFLKAYKAIATEEEVQNLLNMKIAKNKNKKYTDFSHKLSFSKVRK